MKILRDVTALLGVACVAIVGWYAALGLGFGFAWAVILRVLLVATPMALGVAELARLLDLATRRLPYQRSLIVGIGVCLPVFVSPSYLPVPVAVALIGWLIFRLVTSSAVSRHALFLSTAGIIFLFVCIPLINCIVLRLAGSRLMDPAMRWTDEILYSLFDYTTYHGIFPLVKSQAAFSAFENSYLTLAIEPMLVPLVMVRYPRQIALFLTAAFLCYATAAVIFLIFPVIGPSLYFPEALDPRFAGTLTGQVTALLRTEASSIQAGGPPITGLGYFIALPSLHAAMATVTQYHLRESAPHYWLMLPINAGLVFSTFILGQHYVLDTIAGVLLGAAASIFLHRLARPTAADGRPNRLALR
jgi:membrane-associated phospholipid phosphatase